MIDQFGRNITYLRISLTDRCNLRCTYCMPNGICQTAHQDILTYEEILLICETAISLGITHFKVTGGEPFVRKDILYFLKRLKELSGTESVTLTTNGTLLSPFIADLKAIGIDGINISLDAADADSFYQITGTHAYEQVVSNIEQCAAAHIKTKINCVLLPEREDQIVPVAAFAKHLPVDVRFIELMPIGEGASLTPLSPKTARDLLLAEWPDLRPVSEQRGFGPAHYEKSDFLLGRIGWIDAVSHTFCASCNRIRLTSTGMLKPCLCYGDGIDLRKIIRNPHSHYDLNSHYDLKQALADGIHGKPAAHCFQEHNAITEHKKMAEIGG